MRCLLCSNFSLPHICRTCQSQFLRPNLTQRAVGTDLIVYSFYKYHDIAKLLKTKHTYIGSAIYTILAQNSMQLFAREFQYKKPLYALGIDDHAKDGYAHTAILARALNSPSIKARYGKIRAQRDISYSGKNLAYRLSHPRGFSYHDSGLGEVILVDDIITTGTTLLEAKEVLEKAGESVLFSLTLADARDF